MPCETPIAFLIFRRPDLTSKVFETIRQAQPKKLLVVADGSRNESEEILCQQTRAVIESVDWDCEVLKNYADKNLGCRKRVSSGLDWVFAQVEEAIILEDDCLPHPSFFRYCQELLDYYREDERIWCISGDNFQDGQWRGDGSYYFSNYNHGWGWATWQRAWQKYDHNLSNWEKFRDGQYLKNVLSNELEVLYWHSIFEEMFIKRDQKNIWDYLWTLSVWLNELTTGYYELPSEHGWQSLQKLFSKKSALNPVTLTIFVLLSCPWQWKLINLLSIWKRATLQIFQFVFQPNLYRQKAK